MAEGYESRRAFEEAWEIAFNVWHMLDIARKEEARINEASHEARRCAYVFANVVSGYGHYTREEEEETRRLGPERICLTARRASLRAQNSLEVIYDLRRRAKKEAQKAELLQPPTFYSIESARVSLDTALRGLETMYPRAKEKTEAAQKAAEYAEARTRTVPFVPDSATLERNAQKMRELEEEEKAEEKRLAVLTVKMQRLLEGGEKTETDKEIILSVRSKSGVSVRILVRKSDDPSLSLVNLSGEIVEESLYFLFRLPDDENEWTQDSLPGDPPRAFSMYGGTLADAMARFLPWWVDIS